jgi:hypothetical protein
MKQLLLFLGLVILVAGVSAQTISSVPLSLVPHQTVTMPIMLDSAPTGLSGVNLTVTVANGSVATINSIAFPAWATMNDASTLPGTTVTFIELDGGYAIQPGATGITLATLSITGGSTGTTTVTYTVNSMDDDSGAVFTPATTAGSVTVVTSVLPNRPQAVATFTPVDTMGISIIETAIGGSDVNSTALNMNYTGVATGLAYPYTSVMGPVAWVLALSIPFIVMYVMTDKTWIPLIIGIILSGAFLYFGLIPAEYSLPIYAFATLSIVAIIASVLLRR